MEYLVIIILHYHALDEDIKRDHPNDGEVMM